MAFAVVVRIKGVLVLEKSIFSLKQVSGMLRVTHLFNGRVFKVSLIAIEEAHGQPGNDSNLLIVFYVQIMPDDFVMQLHRF